MIPVLKPHNFCRKSKICHICRNGTYRIFHEISRFWSEGAKLQNESQLYFKTPWTWSVYGMKNHIYQGSSEFLEENMLNGTYRISRQKIKLSSAVWRPRPVNQWKSVIISTYASFFFFETFLHKKFHRFDFFFGLLRLRIDFSSRVKKWRFQKLATYQVNTTFRTTSFGISNGKHYFWHI